MLSFSYCYSILFRAATVRRNARFNLAYRRGFSVASALMQGSAAPIDIPVNC